MTGLQLLIAIISFMLMVVGFVIGAYAMYAASNILANPLESSPAQKSQVSRLFLVAIMLLFAGTKLATFV